MATPSIRSYHDQLLVAAGGTWFDFEGLVRDIYVSILKPGDLSLDIGVNEGVHLFQMIEAVGRKGLVIGIEALPHLADQASSRLDTGGPLSRIGEKIGLLKPNYRIHNTAVSNYEGTASFSFVKNATGLSSLARRGVAISYDVDEITVPVTTIDRLLRNVRRPVAFAKIDIEGAEYLALQAGLKIFRDRSPIVFEWDRESTAYFHYSLEDFVALFRRFDYEVSDFFGNAIRTPDDMLQSIAWNFYAAPVDAADNGRIREVSARYLARLNIAIPPLG